MKKKILLLVVLLLMTGCTAEYELTYVNDVFKEHVVVTEPIVDENPMGLSISDINSNSHYIKIGDNNKYNYNLESRNGNHILTLDFEYKDVKLTSSRFYNDCFKNRTFIERDNYYYIELEGDSVCEYLKDVDITFKTDKYVYDINATEKDYEKGIYKWKDFSGGKIIIQVSRNETLKSYNENLDVEFIPWYFKLIISVVVIFIIFLMCRKIKKEQI